MLERRVEFHSEGDTIVGTLYRPDGREGPLPTVIGAGGWCYTKEIVLPHVARIAGRDDVQFLAFDYRGFGESGGQRRQHIDPWAQIQDYRNAVTFAERLDEVDENALGAFGISYSGGHVLILAAIEPRLKAFVSVLPVVDGYTTLKRCHGEIDFRLLEDELLQDLRNRFDGKGGTKAMSSLTPHQDRPTWPYPQAYEVFKVLKETEAPLHEHWSTTESTEQLLNYSVFPYLPRIIERSVMMIVASGDNITSIDLEVDAFNRIPSPDKSLKVLPAAGHMSLYSDRRDTNIAAAHAAEWFKSTLSSSCETA
ncbi:alpha/beta hydrolase [Amycolatopsis endophytica]|uniref:alpha/beta hydrolase n=1 Tax=Amycolatopsis endophytica TaxID=860233 RepID=UPI0028AB6C40|nr:alpha/beta hydrolase [Amycolatopsis endophytica]